MKIAQVCHLYEPVPPLLYGGTERVVAHLCDALVEMGHDVTLFASGDSRVKARVEAGRRYAIRLDSDQLKSDLGAHLAMLSKVRRAATSFDVIHFHTDMLHFPLFSEIHEKCITTLHGRLDIADIHEVYAEWRHFQLISISNSQRQHLPDANWARTIYHGVPETLYRPDAERGGYLVFLGRICPEKGVDRAIRIANRLQVRLKIAAKVDKVDEIYFRDIIQPMIGSGLVDFLGEIDDRSKCSLLARADALLFPIDWPEPFGLVMIEAMACGTPVIAFENGSTPEVVENGITGYLVKTEDQAVGAVVRARKLDRDLIRRRFQERFSSKRMAEDYVVQYMSMTKSVSDPTHVA